jgi:branched-chain amino acid transport system ATP-binding protein
LLACAPRGHNARFYARKPMTRKPMSANFILSTRGLVKEFKGFVAVDGVDLNVETGSIHALIGPNGAGKTTVFNLLTKFLPPTRGQILFKGQDITGDTPSQLARRGIVRSFQISATFGHLSVLDNVRVGLQRATGSVYQFWQPGRVLDRLNDRALELLQTVGLRGNADELAVNLPYGRKRALEIATTLAADPELMLLDEPTQGMGHEDVDRVTELIERISENRTILMVEHNMSVVARIADRISVLQRGRIIAEGNYEKVSNDPLVLEAYMGTAETELEGIGGGH